MQSLKNIAWINNLFFRFDLLWRLKGAVKLHFIYYASLVIILSSMGVYSLHFPPILSENWVTVFLCFLSFLSALCSEFRFDSLYCHIMKGLLLKGQQVSSLPLPLQKQKYNLKKSISPINMSTQLDLILTNFLIYIHMTGGREVGLGEGYW